MTEAMHGVHVERNFVLSSGVVLAEANLAYVTLGRLNSERNNAVLVTHGYTSSHTFVLPDSTAAEGSWSELVGPGKAIDTDRFFVISSNTLGSCYGSTGPASIDPATGRCWGPAFPFIDFSDVIALQKSLVDAWGIRKLHAVAGVSMGGFQALQWGVQYPDAVARLVVALSSLSGARASSAGVAGVRATLAADPAWNDGHAPAGAMQATLSQLRLKTLANYGMDAWLADQHLAPAQRTERMQAMAHEWAASFDANALVTLMQAIESFDVRERLALLKARVLYVLCTTDALFPASMGPEVLQQLRDQGVDARFHALQSDYGHLASGLDAASWSGVLADFMRDAD